MVTPQQVIAFLTSLGDSSSAIAAKLLELGIKGKITASRSCPIARAVQKLYGQELEDFSICGSSFTIYPSWDRGRPPLAVTRFISDFDEGNYPDLVESA